jgi:hypothetical protein
MTYDCVSNMRCEVKIWQVNAVLSRLLLTTGDITGSRQVRFDDIPSDILRAMVAAMHVSRHNARMPSVILAFKKLLPSDLIGLLSFSLRLLMPWAGASYAQAAVEDSKDATTLVKLVSRNSEFYDTDAEEEWRDVVDLAAQRLALVIEDAVIVPGFQDMTDDTLTKIIECMQDGEWADKIELSVTCGHNNPVSATNSHGFLLQEAYDCNKNFIHAQLRSVCSNDNHILLRTGGESLALISVKNKCCSSHIYNAVSNCSWQVVALCGNAGRQASAFLCAHKGYSFKFSFRTRFCKLHRQCLALAGFYAQSQGITLQKVSLEDSWRFFAQRAVSKFGNLYAQFLSKSFEVLKLHHFYAYRAYEIEQIISQDSLVTLSKKEITVLNVVIGWARHKSEQVCAFRAGDTIRTIANICLHRRTAPQDIPEGSDCIVESMKKVDGRDVAIVSYTFKRDSTSVTEAFELDGSKLVSQVHPAHVTGLLILLPRVRWAFIRAWELRTCQSNEDIYYASQYDCYREMVKYIANRQLRRDNRVQGRQVCADHTKPREGYPDCDTLLDDQTDAMVRMLTHVDKPYVCGDAQDERTQAFLESEYVQKVIAERVEEQVRLRSLAEQEVFCVRDVCPEAQ